MLSFLTEYLINLEYSYKDNNHETSDIIKEVPILLLKYNVVGIITNIIDNYIYKREREKDKICE